MSENQRRAFLVGLPEAGKTTFLAALFHVLESSEISSALKLERLHGDHKHLNEIRDLWADAQRLDRTKLPDEQLVSMIVRDSCSGTTAEVVLPDLSGESFELQWTDRRMTADFADLVSKSNGGLLLIHPGKVKEETLIVEAESIVEQLQQANAAGSSPESAQAVSTSPPELIEPEDTASWAAEDAPTAVKLVELLQFVAQTNQTQPMWLSVVVSAWDTLGRNSTQPTEWIRTRLPLVWQYLTANDDVFATQYFGVSAQGRDLSQANRLRQVSRPAERIRVVDDGPNETHDITLPVRWALGWGREHG